MKRIAIGLVMVLLQAYFGSSAMADASPTPPKDKISYSAAPYIVALPVYYFFVQIPLHESSHAALAGLNPNWEVSRFQPYPHLSEQQPGTLVFGSASVTCDREEACNDKTGLGVIALAPYATAATIFVASDLLLSTRAVNPSGATGRVLYFAGMAAPWWDVFYNSVRAVDQSDAAVIARSFEIPRWSVVATGLGVSAVGLWRLYENGKRAFPGQSHSPPKEPNLIVVPMGDSGTIGASASMRF